jgi:phosphatidate cytidylyltransferase
VLRWRLAAAAAMITPLIALLFADVHWNLAAPGVWLVLPGLVIALVATAEVLELLRATGARPRRWAAITGTALIFLASCIPIALNVVAGGRAPGNAHDALAGVSVAVAVAVIIVFVGEMRSFAGPGGAIANLAATMLAVAYVGIPFSFAAVLRQFRGNGWGMAALVSVVFVVKLSDTGAYFLGKAFGRRKLSPALSPGKTVEGGVAGLASAVLASWLFFAWLAPWIAGDEAFSQSIWGSALYGLVLGLMGLLGDLAESLIKRDVQRKDSSSWLPGLGGVLDVLDSLLFAMPIAYLFWSLGVVGPG